MSGLLFFAERQPWNTSISLRIGQQSDNGEVASARPIELVHHDPSQLTQPCLVLEQADAQRLVDELWGVGIRPSEGTGSAGALAATERHLHDMRNITFKLMREVAPE